MPVEDVFSPNSSRMADVVSDLGLPWPNLGLMPLLPCFAHVLGSSDLVRKVVSLAGPVVLTDLKSASSKVFLLAQGEQWYGYKRPF